MLLLKQKVDLKFDYTIAIDSSYRPPIPKNTYMCQGIATEF